MLNSDHFCLGCFYLFGGVHLVVRRTDTFSSFKLFISCSYIGGSESSEHFSVINEACSMLVRP